MIDARLPGILGLPDLRAFLERGIIIDLVGSIAGMSVPSPGTAGIRLQIACQLPGSK